MNVTKQIALQRVHTLFRLAKEVICEDPELAQRYVKIARRIAMGTKLRLPSARNLFLFYLMQFWKHINDSMHIPKRTLGEALSWLMQKSQACHGRPGYGDNFKRCMHAGDRSDGKYTEARVEVFFE